MTKSTKHDSSGSPTPDQAYWQLWRAGQKPDLKAFLSGHSALTSTAIAAIISIDQYERWTSGEQVPAEHYLTFLPTDEESDEAACDVVYGEFILREQLGERPDPESYLLQFPSLREQLSRQFELRRALRAEPEATAANLPPPTLQGRKQTGKLFSAPACIPGYEILEEIGRGGMGVVYKAHQASLHRLVALKIVHSPPGADSSFLDRMRREARITAQVAHPNIVTIYDAGSSGNAFYLAMEYVDGIDLQRLVDQQGPLPIGLAYDYLRQAALGLEHAASKGLVHRDIKPSNLIVTRVNDSTPGVLKILDLGLARFSVNNHQTEHAPLTQLGSFMGTPDFVAPEQAADPRLADARSDLYSLGCTFYFLLTGKAPFGGATPLAKLVQHHLQDAPPLERLRPETPPHLASIIRRLMAKDPQTRFQTARELLLSLAESPERAIPATSSPRRAGLERKLTGHVDRIRGVAFSPINHSLASISLDGDVLVWSLSSGAAEPACLRGETGPLACLGYAPDGTGLFVGAEDGTHLRWDVASRSIRWRARAHPECINALSVGRSGKLLLSGGHEGTLRVWEAASGRMLRSWMAHSGPVWGVLLTPDEQIALSGGQDRGLRLWDVSTGESVTLLPEQPMRVTCLAISPDGRLALTGGIDGVIHLWDLGAYRELGTLEGHESRVTELSFSPDGTRVASSSRDQTVRIWDLHERKVQEVFREHSRWVTCVAWSLDGRHVASGGIDRLVCLWTV